MHTRTIYRVRVDAAEKLKSLVNIAK